MGKVPVPKVEASEAAIHLECSLSPELSRMLANSGGAMQFSLNNGPGEGGPGRTGRDSDRLVSYVRPIADVVQHRRGSPRSGRGHAKAVKVEPGEPPSPISEGSHDSSCSSSRMPEGLPEPELDFDDRITEYVLLPTKVEPGIIWLDGESMHHERIAWGPNSLTVLQVPMKTSASGGHTGSVASSVPLIDARVVDPRSLEDELLEARPRGVGFRERQRKDESAADPGGESSICTPLARARYSRKAPPAMKEINHCWHGESRKSKWQLVQRAVEDPGEVSRLIDEVRRRSRGRSARHRRLGRSNVFAHPQLSLVHG